MCFTKLNIKGSYPSFTEKLLKDPISFALQHTQLTVNELRTTKNCWKSLLCGKNDSWKKETLIEICELGRTYIWSLQSKLIEKINCGLSRSGDIILLKNTIGQKKMDKTRKLVIKTFKDVGFKIEIDSNLKIIDFLGVRLNRPTHHR